MELNACIEAVLFYKAEPMNKKSVADLFHVTRDELDIALKDLESSLQSRGIRLVVTDTHIGLVTAPEMSTVIEHIRKEELSADIGKAGAETLAIILYRGPISRGDIDRIRGVNSTFIIRNLLVRGLIERRTHPTHARSFLYAGTPLLLEHLGISSREALPDFEAVMNSIDTFEKQERIEENQAHTSTH